MLDNIIQCVHTGFESNRIDIEYYNGENLQKKT